MSRVRPVVAATLAVILLATAVAAVMLVVTSGALWAGVAPEEIDPLRAPTGAAEVEAPVTAIGVVESLQLAQPRDPFRPLITEDSPVAGIPGVGGEPGSNGGFDPTGTTITLKEIRDVGGTLRATVTVNGTSFDVGVGDTFAGSYKVVSLTETKGVFMFGDSAFELAVGQQILK